MAIRPCSRCRNRFRGPASTLYHGLLEGSDRFTLIERLCTPCSAEWHHLAGLLISDQPVHYEEQWQIAMFCSACASPISGSSPALFTTAYFPGQEREDFYSQLCQSCADRIEAHFIKNG
jgi:hypothetical protein